jgi:hypothetical protein
VIEDEVGALKQSYPSLPIDSLRMDLMKHRTCLCAVALEILAKNERARAIAEEEKANAR